jgi:hypothetical protein
VGRLSWRVHTGHRRTIVQLARDQGWEPPRDEGCELDWDAEIGGHKDDLVVVNRNWIESKDVPEPADWNPTAQLIRYLEILFEASETVGYVTASWEKEGKFLPTSGAYDRTAGQLIEQLNQCNGDIGAVIGDYNPKAGAWIRFNPLDGKGVKNENVTEYRYALVESDAMDIEQQHAIIHELELPVAVLVHSGKKSLHAIVRVDAANYDEYRKRVDYLYTVCQKNGLRSTARTATPPASPACGYRAERRSNSSWREPRKESYSAGMSGSRASTTTCRSPRA